MSFLDAFFASLAVWREARGEPFAGKLAVANVLNNRVKDPRWPNSMRDVVLQPKQFSSFNAGDPNSTQFPEDNKVWWDCLEVVEQVLNFFDDPTKGANHYHTLDVNPSWADPAKITLIVGNHVFYKL